MATQVKVVVRDGKYGLILHKHGASAWHPANEVHSDSLGRPDKDNNVRSHTEHKADAPEVLKALKALGKPEEAFTFQGVEYKNTGDWLVEEYKRCLEGTTQLYWNVQWKAKLANRKAKRLLKEAAEEAEDEATVQEGELVLA